jgi:uncharacterized protein YbjQ (UPF0145 family)
VPLFRKRPPPPSEEERQAAAVDLQRIEQGGIPLGAEERLKRVAAASAPFFTSDLTAKEYAIAEASGLTPLAQVMGSSVVQHGWQNLGWSSFGGGITEVAYIAAPWNLARQRAFDRLRQEAQLAGAHAVVGIEMTTSAHAGPGNVEYVVFGTAVRDTQLGSGGPSWPRMCALSGQDYDKLRRIGGETVGVIGHTAVVCAALSPQGNQVMNRNRLLWPGNVEIVEVAQGIYTARQLAMGEVKKQATQAGADGMVISTLTHSVDHHEYDRNNYKYHYFIISMHVLGTAIRMGAHEPRPAPLREPVMSINLGA